ncbi:MAG: hypothetical protein AAFX46_21545, partial [Cyanobacteria bacterium J06636_27]
LTSCYKALVFLTIKGRALSCGFPARDWEPASPLSRYKALPCNAFQEGSAFHLYWRQSLRLWVPSQRLGTSK